MLRPIAGIVVVVMLWGAAGLIACGSDGPQGTGTGVGATQDVGKECVGACTGGEDGWCYDKNQATCVSWVCVGRSTAESYCTELCDLDTQCPDGYSCVDDCEIGSFDQAYCVKDEDHDDLETLGFCDESR
ncbi:MAG: hypothetical protein KJ042_12420 [Deltaproteobacteria bacterium]|nr:hypothetical protein [Deltaproteobacteria bacterium]